MLSNLKSVFSKRKSSKGYTKNFDDLNECLLEEREESISIENAWNVGDTFTSINQRINQSAAMDVLHGSYIERTLMGVSRKDMSFDKIFASEWINDTSVLFGTKDNQLRLWDTTQLSFAPVKVELPNPSKYVSNIKDQKNNQDVRQHCADTMGMHAISVSPNGEYVITGGYHHNDITLFEINHKKEGNYAGIGLEPINVLQKHKEWISSLQFLDYDRFVSSSKDGNIVIWSLPKIVSKHSSETHSNHSSSNIESFYVRDSSKVTDVRDMSVNAFNKCIVTLSSNGLVSVFDSAERERLFRVELPHNLCCVTVKSNENKGLISVGSIDHLQLFDPRNFNQSYNAIQSMDHGYGVRSIEWMNEYTVSIAGGFNRLYYFDTRMNQYLSSNTQNNNKNNKCCRSLKNGITHRNNNNNKKQIILQTNSKNNSNAHHNPSNPFSVYTHNYNSNTNKIFIGGGPTSAQLSGNKISVLTPPSK